MPKPKWSRDELILALDLYIRHRDPPPGKNSAAAICLSNQLSDMGMGVGYRDANYRNPSGVYVKMMNFRSLNPSHISAEKKDLPI